MFFIKTLRVEKRINSDADCMTVFNYPDRNLVDHLTHKDSNTYKHFPKRQVVGVWRIKNLKYQ